MDNYQLKTLTERKKLRGSTTSVAPVTKQCLHFALEGKTPLKPLFCPCSLQAVAARGDYTRNFGESQANN